VFEPDFSAFRTSPNDSIIPVNIAQISPKKALNEIFGLCYKLVYVCIVQTFLTLPVGQKLNY
jgi:hypothetical protein